ncbi:MAG: type II 3-dehydroquinate dehydratase [Candidatus Neomarinimicrobiota bacterium]|jgi:3-dehydroquinate dehydratase-2|nr:3-dehydroquinate dehydratase [Candidatus Neomarinimicrobiota bacterium]
MPESKGTIMKILIIHGPNLNMLGHRDKSQYGNLTLDKLNALLRKEAGALNIELSIYQFNSEEKIIRTLQRQRNRCDAVILNPAAYTHYSYAIRDTIELLPVPVVEVHLSNIYEREDFRRISVTKDVCLHQIYGKKEQSYVEALHFLYDHLREKS